MGKRNGSMEDFVDVVSSVLLEVLLERNVSLDEIHGNWFSEEPAPVIETV